jgi:predicted glycosyltransferase involved in capsule biosynthesis
MPAYYVNKVESQRINKLLDFDKIDSTLASFGFSGQTASFGSKLDFIAPYSNIFLINKKFFSISGGYHKSFIGYGSEDFEYTIRLSLYSSYFFHPAEIDEDTHSPIGSSFWESRQYSGFRSISQMMTGRAERAGLKIFHIWHPRVRNSDWQKKKDHFRKYFQEVYSSYARG